MAAASSSRVDPGFPGPTRVKTIRDEAWSKRNLLSLDGGGIRGYWTLLVLEQLMVFIAEEEQKQAQGSPQARAHRFDSFWPEEWPANVAQYAGQPIPYKKLRSTQKYLPCHYFDFICGSSTGGLIAIMLSRFRMSVEDCLREYEDLSHRIFGKPRWCSQRNLGIVPWSKYSAKSMEDVFKDVTRRRCEGAAFSTHSFNAPTFPTVKNTCAVFVTTLRRTKNAARIEPEKLYILRSYDNNPDPPPERRSRYNLGNSEKMEMWQIARAATAAPMYFDEFKVFLSYRDPPERIYFTDGGFGATNNPTQVGIQEVKSLHGDECMGIIVSIGTARAKDQPGGKNLFKRVKKFASTATDPDTVAHWLEDQNLNNYWRFNDEHGIDIELDDWKPNGWITKHPGRNTLAKIRNNFNEWFKDRTNSRSIEACAAELVTQRRARVADRSLWQRFATGACEYRCKYKDCGERTYDDLQQFNEHWRNDHSDSQDAGAWRDPKFETWAYQKQNGLSGTHN